MHRAAQSSYLIQPGGKLLDFAVVAPAAANDDVAELPPLHGRTIPNSGLSIVSGLSERFERQHLAFKKVRILLVGGKGDVHGSSLLLCWRASSGPIKGLPALFSLSVSLATQLQSYV